MVVAAFDEVLQPDVVEGAIADAVRRLTPNIEALEAQRARITARTPALEAEKLNFVAAVAVAPKRAGTGRGDREARAAAAGAGGRTRAP